MLNYLDSFQNFLAGYVVVAIGYLCSFFNMFNIKQISAVRRVFYLTAIPGMMFYQIGKTDPSKKVWSPLLIAFLVQVTLHVIFAIVSWVFPFSNHKKRFLSLLFAIVHSDFLMFGSPLAQYLWDSTNYISVAVISSVCESFLITPIHLILTYNQTKLEGFSDSSDEVSEYESEDYNNNNNNNNESIRSNFSQTGLDIHLHPDGNSDTPNDQQSSTQNANENQEENTTEKKKNTLATSPLFTFREYVETNKMEERKNSLLLFETSFKRHFIFSFVNATNVTTVIGIIWSFCPWGMFKLIDEFAGDLSKAVAGVGLFCIGCFMWEHPFAGCNWIEVIIYFILHSFGVPFLSMLFCYLLKIDKDISKVIVLMHSMPVSLTGYLLGKTSGVEMESASFTWFYTNLLALPLQMIWAAIINNIKFLN